MSESEIKIRHKNYCPFMMIPDAIWEMNLTHDQMILFMRLIHHANQNTQTAWPSRKCLISAVYPSVTFDRGRKNFDSAMRVLCSKNMVEKSRRVRENGSQKSNEYIINPEFEWINLGSKPTLPPLVKNDPTPLGSKTTLPPRVKNDPTLNQIQSEPDPTKNNTNTKKREDLDAGCVALPASAQTPAGLFGDWEPKAESEQGPTEGQGIVFELGAKQGSQGFEAHNVLTHVCNATDPGSLEPKKRQKRVSKPKELTEGSKVWEIYEQAYENKYSTKPIRNAKQNSLCAQLVLRLGAGAGPVIEYYLTHKNRYYVEHTHALGLCVKDCESLHTQMLRGQQMTSTQAHQEDKHGAADDVLNRRLKKIDEKYANK